MLDQLGCIFFENAQTKILTKERRRVMSNYTKEIHRTNNPIKDDMGYCLAKPGDRVRITKTHLADQYVACEGDTFVITGTCKNRWFE